jgi:lipoyl(octanoyl) transferase
MRLTIEDWGFLGYEEAHARQRDRVAEVRADPARGFLCLVEHPPVYTMGRFGSASNVLDPSLPIRRIERGGDVTYHGPGQLVGYAILDLRRRGLTVKGLVGALERLVADAVREFGVEAAAREGVRGVWVEDRKLASIGLALARGGVTWHGFALNVSTDLRAFDRIHPCGLAGVRMTSLSAELGHEVSMAEARETVGRRSPAYLCDFSARPVAPER